MIPGDACIEQVVQRVDPAPGQGRGAVHHAEDRADGRAVAVGVEAGLHRRADRPAVVLLAPQQAERDDLRVGVGVAPVVRVELVPAGVDAADRFLDVNPLVMPADHLLDVLGQAAPRRDLAQADPDDVLDIVSHTARRQHRRHPHLAVDAVLDVADRGIAPGELGRQLRVARRGVAEEVGANLRADPLAVGVAVGRRGRRRDQVDEVAIRHALGGAGVEDRDVLQPEIGDILGREARARAASRSPGR